MSPEQAMGREVDFRSDQFSFGTLLYEMIAGKRPFRRESQAQTLASIIEVDPDPLPAVRADVPDHLVAIVSRCLAKRPDERYGSTVDLAHDLADLRDQLRTGSRPASLARRVRRDQRLLALATVMTLMVVVALIILSRFARPGGTPSLLPAEKRLAILAFANVGGNPAGQAFSDGLVADRDRGRPAGSRASDSRGHERRERL